MDGWMDEQTHMRSNHHCFISFSFSNIFYKFAEIVFFAPNLIEAVDT